MAVGKRFMVERALFIVVAAVLVAPLEGSFMWRMGSAVRPSLIWSIAHIAISLSVIYFATALLGLSKFVGGFVEELANGEQPPDLDWRRLLKEIRRPAGLLLIAAVLVMAFAPGSRSTGLPRPEPQTPSSGEPTSLQANMRRAIASAISADGVSVDGLEIEVGTDRSVTLSGTVKSEDLRRSAEAVATSSPGVTRVVNKLRVQ